MTLLDTSCVPAVGSGFEKARPYSTISMHVQFLAGSADSDLVAAGWVTRRGNSIVFCEAEVETTDGKTLAKGALAFKI